MGMDKMKNAVTEIENTELAIIDYKVTDAAIAELKKKHVVITVTSNKDLAIVQKSITELTSIRTSVEKKRKELKADALEWGRKVDGEAKRITGLLEEIEQPLVDAKKTYNDEQERTKAETARKEKERVDTIIKRIEDVKNHPLSLVGKSLEAIQSAIAHFIECSEADIFDYQEFSEQATVAKQETIDKLRTLEDERIIFEREQAAEAIRRQEAEAARIEMEAAQAKLKEEQRLFAEKQAEAARAEEEKAVIARKATEEAEHAQRLVDLERQKAENARLAEIEGKRLAVEREQLELDRQKAAHEAKIAADKIQAEREEQGRMAQHAPEMYAALDRIFHIADSDLEDRVYEAINEIRTIAEDITFKVRGGNA